MEERDEGDGEGRAERKLAERVSEREMAKREGRRVRDREIGKDGGG